MATSTNILLKDMRGSLGGILTVKQYQDKIVLTKKQRKPSVPRSDGQVNGQLKFSDAQQLACLYLKDPAIKARYQSICPPGKRAYNLLISELLKHNGKLP